MLDNVGNCMRKLKISNLRQERKKRPTVKILRQCSNSPSTKYASDPQCHVKISYCTCKEFVALG